MAKRNTLFALLVVLSVTGPVLAAAGPIRPSENGLIDLPMDHLPTLPRERTTVTFSPRLKTLWLAALARPESDLRWQAAAAFGQAFAAGMGGLKQVEPILVEHLRHDAVLTVRLAAARALVRMDDAAAAPAMIAQSKVDGYAMVAIVDPTLARWHNAAAIRLWRRRVNDARTRRDVLISAIRSLGAVQDKHAGRLLIAIAQAPRRGAAVRLAAARALGRIPHAPVVTAAAQLAEAGRFDRLLAAEMLDHHASPRAVKLLFQLGDDNAPTVAAAALTALNHVSQQRLAARADHWLDAGDPDVRLAATRSLAVRHDATAVAWLSDRLGDTDTTVRNAARKILVADSKQASLRTPVLTAIRSNLAGDNWRAIEQAALIAKQIDDRAAARRLVQLLDNARPEVRLAVSAALRRFSLPSTMPALLRRAEQLTRFAQHKNGGETSEQIGQESTQIFQAFGFARYQPADALLRKYIPKSSPFSSNARAAAIWALGKLHAGKPDQALVRKLVGRLNDHDMMNPEDPTVQRFSAIALGRMQARDTLGSLRQGYQSEESFFVVQMACRWALMHITGKSEPEPKLQVTPSSGWFLEPSRQ